MAAGGGPDPSELPLIEVLQWVGIDTGLDLDQDDAAVHVDYEIDLIPTVAEISSDDRRPSIDQKAGGEGLAQTPDLPAHQMRSG